VHFACHKRDIMEFRVYISRTSGSKIIKLKKNSSIEIALSIDLRINCMVVLFLSFMWHIIVVPAKFLCKNIKYAATESRYTPLGKNSI
jgi:hypothetical protein